MSTLRSLPISLSIALYLLKKDHVIYKNSLSGDPQKIDLHVIRATSPHFIYIDGANSKASSYSFGYGEYLDEPRFSDDIYLRENNTLTAYRFTTQDLYANDYYLIFEEAKLLELMGIITPLLPYGKFMQTNPNEVYNGV